MRAGRSGMVTAALAAGAALAVAGCGADATGTADSGSASGASNTSASSSTSTAQRSGTAQGSDTALQVDSTADGGQPSRAGPPELESVDVAQGGDSSPARIVFRFSGTDGKQGLPRYDIGYVDGYPTEPGSGKEVEMSGQLFLDASFGTATVDDSVRETREPGGPIVAQTRYLGSFERVPEFGIGISSCPGAPRKAAIDTATQGSSIVVTISPAPCGQEESVSRQCGDVSFEAESDAGAFGITATNVDCDTARRVATTADVAQGNYHSDGFTCRGQAVGGQLGGSNYSCGRDDARITFTVS